MPGTMQERKGGRAGAWESTPHRLFYPPSSFPQRLPIRQPQHSDPDTPCLLACLRCDNPWLGLECRASQARVPCSPRSQRTVNSTLQFRESSHTNFLGQKEQQRQNTVGLVKETPQTHPDHIEKRSAPSPVAPEFPGGGADGLTQPPACHPDKALRRVRRWRPK